MAKNYGKDFERKFKEDFLKIPDSTLDRLPDIMSGYKSIKGICDFIGYIYPNIYYLECKSVHGNTFPLTSLTQYDKMLPKTKVKGVRTGVIIWFVDHSKVVYVPISSVERMRQDNIKSVNIKMLAGSEYSIFEMPSSKKRVFLDTDYSKLKTLEEGQ